MCLSIFRKKMANKILSRNAIFFCLFLITQTELHTTILLEYCTLTSDYKNKLMTLHKCTDCDISSLTTAINCI